MDDFPSDLTQIFILLICDWSTNEERRSRRTLRGCTISTNQVREVCSSKAEVSGSDVVSLGRGYVSTWYAADT